MQGVETGFKKEDPYKRIQLENPNIMLKDVISEIKEGGDVEGAALINEKNEIIISTFSKETEYDKCIPEILALMKALKSPDLCSSSDTFFTQRIFDQNGFKILAKNIMDGYILLVFLKKRGYISLAMLDIENSTIRINQILHGDGG